MKDLREEDPLIYNNFLRLDEAVYDVVVIRGVLVARLVTFTLRRLTGTDERYPPALPGVFRRFTL